MQLAINVLIFCVGFSIAIFTSLRPKRARTDLDRLIHNVQYVFDALKLRSKETNQEGVAEKGRGAEYLLTT